jgi:TrkA domain protein
MARWLQAWEEVMVDVQKNALPGVGVRYDFVTSHGRRIGVITHRGGQRELLVYDDRDPDACREVVPLEEEDTRALAELLGASRVTETLTRVQSLEGLTIDWLPVEAGSVYAGSEIGQTDIRERTGVSIVAVVRGGKTMASPALSFRLEAGDTVVAIGTPEGIGQAFTLLRGR